MPASSRRTGAGLHGDPVLDSDFIPQIRNFLKRSGICPLACWKYTDYGVVYIAWIPLEVNGTIDIPPLARLELRLAVFDDLPADVFAQISLLFARVTSDAHVEVEKHLLDHETHLLQPLRLRLFQDADMHYAAVSTAFDVTAVTLPYREGLLAHLINCAAIEFTDLQRLGFGFSLDALDI
jgi:hypothetical protein